MIVLDGYQYTFRSGQYITSYRGEMVATIKFFKGAPPKSFKSLQMKNSRAYVSEANQAVVDVWVSSQPREIVEEGVEKLRTYLDAGGNPKGDSFKR